MKSTGLIIARARLEKGWSQEGLCKGICAVSYLSKIESGRTDASDEIISLLFKRLGISWSRELEREAEALAENAYEALFSGCYTELEGLLFGCGDKDYSACAAGLDLELLRRSASGAAEPLSAPLEKQLDSRALALQRILQGREEEAIALMPNAYSFFMAGIRVYSKGDYIRAAEHLNNAYSASCDEGCVKLMLLIKLFLGACCANRRDTEGMERHYAVARRIAKATGDSEAVEQMDYNRAATAIECGKYEEAYAYFSKLAAPKLMSLHKLAICCEMTGRRDEALCALEKAEGMESEYPPTELARKLCGIVKYRLEHEDYLHREEYGAMLLSAFEFCRRELSAGYALFHLPWVLDWYKTNRQYKKALELMEEFPR